MGAAVVYCEAKDGVVKKPSLEAVSAAASLCDSVVAVICDANDNKDALGKAGAAAIVHQAADYSPHAHASIVAEAAKAKSASVVFASASLHGREVGALAAAMLDCPVLSDCTAVESISPLKVKHPVYAGKAIATLESGAPLNVVTLRPNSSTYEDKNAAGAVEAGSFPAEGKGVSVSGFEKGEASRPELTEADIIVSGGRGLGGADKFDIIEALADALGAGVGASRAVVDAGWRPHGDQVGQTGKTVSPKLYFACAISGAVQHLAGMRTSKVIVAINKDKEAPIFKIADYGIVGDVFEVLPKLTEEVKKL